MGSASTRGKGISASCWPSSRCSGARSARGGCTSAAWRGYAVGWHVLGGDKGKLPRRCPCRGWYRLGRGRGRGYLGLRHSGKLALQSGYAAVFIFKPCRNLCCAFAVEGHGNDGLPLISGKVAALAVMVDAIPALRLGPLWLVSVMICSFSLLYTNETKLAGIIPRYSWKVLLIRH